MDFRQFPLLEVFLHSAITLPGVQGDATTINKVKTPNLKAYFSAAGVFVEGKDKNGRFKCGLIPSANVKIMTFAELPDEKTERSKPAH
jgi:hypothetical protein